jgi:hypothetical protein
MLILLVVLSRVQVEATLVHNLHAIVACVCSVKALPLFAIAA